ncbi:alpha/beta hydrolase family protein [Sessilibacter corallicola]|uniref:S9 family peptidase n=1 Tax=Sessilibacter corallicola TaxID=2904075 RepID=A0ABQ0A4K0_9GAMM
MTILPYGSWPSDIDAQQLVSQSLGLAEPRWDGDCLYWLEFRPNENGRNCLVKRDNSGDITDLLPNPMSSRTRANEYGGGSYCVSNGTVFFVLADDQRIYQLDADNPQSEPKPVTQPGPYRYADLIFNRQRNEIICVREDHSQPGEEETAALVAIDCATGNTKILTCGDDFYASVQLSQDHSQLCWLSWNHPSMPWENTSVFTATITESGELETIKAVKGSAAGEKPQSIFQPRWSANGELLLVTDESNWWRFYKLDSNNQWQSFVALDASTENAEFATPQWVFGLSTWDFLNEDHIIASYTIANEWYLATITISTGELTKIPCQYSDISGVSAHQGKVAFLGATYNQPSELVVSDLSSTHVVRGLPSTLNKDVFSKPSAIEFGPESEKAHAFYYPPHNPNYQGPNNEQPPLIVMAHGGPTSARSNAFNIKIQYWCSRGFAVLDVNYRGSTGYGRDYRLALNGQWGISDVDDVCRGAEYLVEKGLADPNKLAIKGGSAGGYTVLAALTFKSVFKAGASHYGIGNLETLVTDTHKFESRYLDSLIGQYPQDKALYEQRSPINYVEQLDCPVIFFQGGADKVVPPNQAETMVKALDEKNIPVAYVLFPEEGHGFRKADNMIRSVEGELYFYSKIFNFDLPENIPAVEIKNIG